ncbi:MAG: hypothetical protein U9O96_05310 [Candidatus Thermoplasmatota archaeon]|nr:hypothetical protein [Candidatus Thermoplasmatota archaeon]
MSYNNECDTDGNIIYDKLKMELCLLERHIKILKIILDKGPVGIIKLSEVTKFPQHKVRYSLRILEEEGLIRPSPRGAIATDKSYKFIMKFKDLLDELGAKINELKRIL